MERRFVLRASPEAYRGIVVHAHPGIHDAAEAALQTQLAAGARVLDVGAGAGAFSRRLADRGFRVSAVDVDASEWSDERLGDIEFFRLDVESDLATLPTGFDAICLLEVLEHLAEPLAVLRTASALLRPGGTLLLTTPNVSSFLSRVVFLQRGRFFQFLDDDRAYGHINPHTAPEIEIVAERLGFDIVRLESAGPVPLVPQPFSMRLFAATAAGLALYPLMRGLRDGWCVLALMRKRG